MIIKKDENLWSSFFWVNFIFLGKYSKAGLTGFINNPSQDRKSIISSMMEKAGGKLDALFLTRGTMMWL